MRQVGEAEVEVEVELGVPLDSGIRPSPKSQSLLPPRRSVGRSRGGLWFESTRGHARGSRKRRNQQLAWHNCLGRPSSRVWALLTGRSRAQGRVQQRPVQKGLGRSDQSPALDGSRTPPRPGDGGAGRRPCRYIHSESANEGGASISNPGQLQGFVSRFRRRPFFPFNGFSSTTAPGILTKRPEIWIAAGFPGTKVGSGTRRVKQRRSIIATIAVLVFCARFRSFPAADRHASDPTPGRGRLHKYGTQVSQSGLIGRANFFFIKFPPSLCPGGPQHWVRSSHMEISEGPGTTASSMLRRTDAD